MTTLALSESPARRTWTDALLAILGQPHEAPRHLRAAALLPLFASPSSGAAIEAILLDRDRDAWVRTYALRALERRAIPLTDDGLDQLLAELAADLAAPSQGAWPRRLSAPDGVASAVAVARSPIQRARVARFLAGLDGATARALLLEDRVSAHRFDAAMAEVLHRRCVEAGALDPELAWATLERAESRALVLGSRAERGAGWLDQLERATGDLDPEALAAIFADHPRALAAAVEGLALPVPFLLQQRAPEQLGRAARQLVRDLDRRMQRGERRLGVWKPVQVLAALPSAVDDLDALVREAGLGEPVRQACAAARLRCSPPPRFDALPEQSIASYLRSLRPEPRDRPLLAWALESPHPAFQYAALSGLAALDHGLEPAVIQRLRGSGEPLLHLAALGGAARAGDPGAADELMQAALAAPHVVLRAQALRALRTAAPRPASYVDLCIRSLRSDKEVFDLYYAPATAEAALGLARHSATAEAAALEALVDASLHLANDEAWWAIEGAICSWLDHAEADIRPIWYWMYLSPAHRDGR